MDEKQENPPFKPGAKSKKIIAVTLGIALGLMASGLLIIRSNQSENQIQNLKPNPQTTDTQLRNEANTAQNISPTPVPFAELTIPYLRNRTYQSSLENRQPVSSDNNYSSYTAFYNSDGLRINGLLTIPTGDQPENGWPAIIFIHGYIPPTLYRTTSNYASYVDYFARNGFVVYKIDLRGHDQSEGEPGGAYYSGDYIIDTLNAKAALQNSDFVDPDRIGLWGHSMAGNVVFRSMVADTNIPAAVIWAGAVYSYDDFQELRLNDNSYRPPSDNSERRRKRQELYDTHGEFDARSSYWQQVVPLNYLDNVTGNLQIHHAVNDPVVNVEYSRGLIEALQGSSINHELFEYQSGGHNIESAAFNQAMQRSVAFFKKNL